jgi:predicted TIM-barrel fold metal-dependent hydrolase
MQSKFYPGAAGFAAAAVLAVALGALVRSSRVHAQEPAALDPNLSGGNYKGGPMDKVLLKDYKPDSSLVVPEHHPAKAKYPAIDVHSHVYAQTPAEVAEWVKTMDEAGVETTVILTGATGERFDRLVDLYLKPYPKRFILFAGIDISNYDAPDYPERAARELERCYRQGARGVGELTDKGSGLGGFTGFGTKKAPPPGQRLHIDDPRLDFFWKKCAELKIPASLHVADHPSAWRPPDEHQERSPLFQRFNQYGQDVDSCEKLIERRNNVVARHPETTFIAVHLGNEGNHLAAFAKDLDQYPNLYSDISARGYEVGREPHTAARFLAKYRTRILYGTDQGRDKAMYQAWWRLFETEDEYIPGPNWWRLYGLNLPNQVLESLYRGNAKKILNWTPPF